mgnify:FL=1
MGFHRKNNLAIELDNKLGVFMLQGASDNQARFAKLCQKYAQVGDLHIEAASKAENKLLAFLTSVRLDTLKFNEKIGNKTLLWMITIIAVNGHRDKILKHLLQNNQNLSLFDFNAKGDYGVLGDISVLSLIAFLSMRGHPEFMQAITANNQIDLKKLKWNDKGIDELTPLWMVAKTATDGHPQSLNAILSQVPKELLDLQVKPKNGTDKNKTVQMLIDQALPRASFLSSILPSSPFSLPTRTAPTRTAPTRTAPTRTAPVTTSYPMPSTAAGSNGGRNGGNHGGNQNFLPTFLIPSRYPNIASLMVGIGIATLAMHLALPSLLLPALTACVLTRAFFAVRHNLYHRYPIHPATFSRAQQAAYQDGKAAARSLTAYFSTFTKIRDWRHFVIVGTAMEQELDNHFAPKRPRT